MSPRKGMVSPTSRRARLTDVLRLAQRHRPAGLTFAELLAAYRTAHPASRATHDTLSASLGALLYDGEVRQSATSSGAVRYRVSSTRRTGSEGDEELAGLVVQIVSELHAVHGRPISTREVSELLRTRGLWPYRYPGLHHLLNRVARSSSAVGPAAGSTKRGAAPPLLRRVQTTTATGRGSAVWIPARSRKRATVQHPTTAADALRRAVEAAPLSRPIAAREIRWWLESRPVTEPVRVALGEGRLGRLLKNVADVDRPHAGTPGRLHVVTTDLTCHGGAPPRYLLRPPSDAEVAACRLDDALYALRPAQEISGIGALRTADLNARDRAIVALAEARERVLIRQLEPWVTRNALRRLRASLDTIERWFDRTTASSEGTWFTRRRLLTDARAQLTAASRLLRGPVGVRGSGHSRRMLRGEPSVLAGEGALVEPRVLRAMAELAVRVGDLDAGRPDLVYAGARRFPRSSPLPDDRLPVGGEFALIDRMDALVALVERSRCPQAWTMASAAKAHLGEVVRDAGWIARLATAPVRMSAVSRAALIVAAGLLGKTVAFGAAAPSASDGSVARACLLGAALASLTVDRALDYAMTLESRARGPARRSAASAVEQLRAGRLLGVVERTGLELGELD